MSWKEVLAGDMPADWAREIDVFETQIELKKQGKLTDQLFAETRLRRGAYGQRYDNGQRNDGTGTKALPFASSLTKGPETLFDAPGMQRIKIPFGGMNPRQMEVLADLCEEYSDNICHVTTRQDFQLHYVHIDDTPDIMRRLAAVGITTREACGNSVRNVTGCPLAGVCRDEQFDISPYADAMMHFMLGHPDTMEFGRKFKIAFSGCAQHACGLLNMHDLGLLAVTKVEDGVEQRGFTIYVGGGLGAVPHSAKVLEEFVTEDELLPISQAIARVFARLGEKRNRARARIKFLIKSLGIDEFRRLVREERAKLPHDPRWTSYIPQVAAWHETPLKAGAALNGAAQPDGFAEWHQQNVYRQRQPGYVVATVTLPLGDITADQMRALADIAREYVGDTVRTTVDQNIVLRWVREADLPDLHRDLAAAKLATPGAQTIVDVTSCPGTDTCKLGIASSRGLARELRSRMTEKSFTLDAAVRGLLIKVSGCFNSCGQHHVADLGFYGVSRQVGGYQVPHFQVVLGGQWTNNGGSYGLPIGAIPSKNIPAVVDRLTERYVRDRQGTETFQQFCGRIGKKALKEILDEFVKVPAHDVEPGLLRRLGRSARVQHRRHGHRRMRRRSGVAGRVRPRRRRARGLRGPAGARSGRREEGRRARVPRDAAGGEGAGEDPAPRRRRRPGAHRGGVQDPLRRYRALLRPLRQGHGGRLSLPPPRGRPRRGDRRVGAPAGRGGEPVRRGWPRLPAAHDGEEGRPRCRGRVAGREPGRAELTNPAIDRRPSAARFVRPHPPRSIDMPAALSDLHRIGIKIPCTDAAFPARELVPVFHRWIQTAAIPGHLLVDVADYDHVPEGPGILLVAHEGNLGIDLIGGQLGLLYYRKQPLAGDLAARLRACTGIALHACRLLEQDPALGGRLRFNAGQLEIFANDRLRAPNAPATYDAFQPELDRLLHTIYGDARCSVTRPADARARFGVSITAPQTSVDQALARLG